MFSDSHGNFLLCEGGGHHFPGAEAPTHVRQGAGAPHHERGAQEGQESVRRSQVRSGIQISAVLPDGSARFFSIFVKHLT